MCQLLRKKEQKNTFNCAHNMKYSFHPFDSNILNNSLGEHHAREYATAI